MARGARSRRQRGHARSVTIAEKTSDVRARERLRLPILPTGPAMNEERPRIREQCRGDERPCPWVGCRHHLYLEVTAAGGLKLNFPTLEPWELQHSCSLDVAEQGGIVLEKIAELTNLTRERVRQIELRGLLTIGASSLGAAR